MAKDNNDDKPSWLLIATMITFSMLIFIWNFTKFCTPMAAFKNWSPPPNSGIQTSFFPIIRVYYAVTCLLFWIFPFLLLIKSTNLIIKKCW